MCLYICFHIHISNYKCRPAFLLSDLNVNLTELLLCNLARCSAHKILCISIHWEWDDLSDILLVSEKHDHSVHTRSHTCMRWCSELECIVECSELLLQIISVYPAISNALTMIFMSWFLTAPDESSIPLQTISYW